MKIYLRQLSNNTNHYTETIYKILSIDKCCDFILQIPIIDFVVDYDPMVAIRQIEEVPEPYEDYTNTEITNYPIQYCPFCNEKIEIEIIEEVDVTKECVNLEMRMSELYKKIRDCDSKKKEAELRQQVRFVENEYKYYTVDDNFSEYKKIED